jgi:ketosteroid isomerase-like protein
MLSWLANKVLSHNYERLRAGDYRPVLRFDAKDVRFRFPGNNSWSGEMRGKREVERWLQRFVATGLQIFADEIVVKGPPWNTTLCLRGHDYLKSADGETVYENRYVIWGRARWGLLKEYEVYEDTEKATALDEYLAEHGDAVAASFRAAAAAPA